MLASRRFWELIPGSGWSICTRCIRRGSFLNKKTDAEITSVGQENFDWIVNAVAEMAVKMAGSGENPVREMRWAEFLAGTPAKQERKGEPEWVAARKRGKGTK